MKMRYVWVRLFLVVLFLVIAGCNESSDVVISDNYRHVEVSYDFETGTEGWIAGFADLPVSETYKYQLESSHRELPSGPEGNGLYIQGYNYSGDLFMFFKKQFSGLKPDTTYQVAFEIELATNVPEGMVGAGGSPGESVCVKAGVTDMEPFADEDESGWFRMNIDKGNQAESGEDAVSLGNIASPDVQGDEYQLKILANTDTPFTVTTDSDGGLWVIIGTDSGYEGLTALYYDHVMITLDEAEAGQNT
ncbi:hypothetical protein DENIS_2389 [Desulfonema ishimotonii]|uniref:Lipoprotein n=1 Tax=Desulfonema ishimotonii TaxID=45657 RepID=A0A401FWW0_9BACT|nr:hypothetical protein [Desulfonema ishimotonii]GBC61429.1 hypothetical protein DENIS_2389 [Desulfonema ishimotonii]